MIKKRISLIISIIIVITFFLGFISIYANDTKIYVNLQPMNLNGVGYGIGNPKNGSGGNYIWSLRTYDSNNIGAISAKQRELYCIKANYGNTWNANRENIVEYNLSYKLNEDREKVLNLLGKNPSNEANKKVLELLNAETGYYKQILWILDNAFISGTSDKTTYLEKIGIKYDKEYQVYYYEPTDGYDYSDIATTGEYTYLLTDDDINAIQKTAIWYYTNYKIDGEEAFNKKDSYDWLTITTDGENYKQLIDITRPNTSEGTDRDEQAKILYNYLIDAAEKNANKYTEENGYSIEIPAKVNTEGLEQDNSSGEIRYKLTTKRVGEDYIIGPIKIDKKNDLNYEIDLKVTNEKGEEVGSNKYKYTDSTGTEIPNVTSIKDLVGKSEGFYIKVSRSLAEEVRIEINVNYEKTKKTLWLKGIESSDSIELEQEQPIIEIEKVKQEEIVKFISKPEEFDLALRKYITQINGKDINTVGETIRVPKIEEGTLLTGTTATYKHRKAPISVRENDIITYQITIYNEGNREGYASKIVDQLPVGLINSTENTGKVTSVGKDGKSKNTYNLTYDPTYNTITFNIENTPNNLKAYSSENGLDYETITFKCKVVEKPDEKVQKILTNVAWIGESYDAKAGKIAEDRDSQTEAKPNVNKNNMQNYIGNTNNKTDLTDNNYFYQGEQDDDDFEKVVILPETKKFDLALFKYIAAVSKDQNIQNGEYITDTKNIDGTYLRAPVVKSIKDGIVQYEEDAKSALTVEPGDYVLYTIRVYNEGEKDGYASKIKDTLPIGLEFVSGNEEYNGIWNLDGYDEDGRQIVTTTWFAKGQGAELNSTVGDPNYTANLLKALDPDGEINKENPDYIEAQVLCKVIEDATSDRVLVNYAQISDDSDSEGKPIEDIDSTPDEWIDGEDDQDIERIKLQCFDLSLRKFVTKVNGKDLKDESGKYIREPKVDLTPLTSKTGTTAIYNHTKMPVPIKIGDKVTYTIRVYNEGDINGYASEITDYLPPYLVYDKESEINKQYKWILSEDGRRVTSTYLKDKQISAFDGSVLDYEDVVIECKILDNSALKQKITNIAEISEYIYNGNVVSKDIDSIPDNMESAKYLPDDEKLPTYKDDEISKEYVPGNEDDDDFEKLYVKEFDLALRKFITKVQENEITVREPQEKIENGQIKYEHPKEPLIVHVNDIIIYTIRVYNEGEIDGYASEITDDIPEYLEYLPEESTNIEYMWKMYDKDDKETTEVNEAVKIKTNYLSKENGEDNIIKAFDGEKLDYKEVKIAFKVKDPNSNETIITNHAQISDDADEEGNPVKDKDSIPGEWNEGEDDQDIENVKVNYFDLSLLKYVTKTIVIENGVEKITETGYNGLEDPEPIVKVELHRKKLDDVVVKFGYGIRITNEGDIAGYANEITDYIPEGLKFNQEDNPEWVDEGNNVISTRQLEGKLLQPGESATVEVILTWINDENNLSLKTNTAEISEDDNEYDVPDRDSTPDNKKEGEDDIDIAKVILSIATGEATMYISIIFGILIILSIGILLIKKFII